MIFIYAEALGLPASVWENALLVRPSYFVTVLTATGKKCQANFNKVGATAALNDNSLKTK